MEIYITRIFQNYKYGLGNLEEDEAFLNFNDGMQWLNEEFFNSEYYDDQFTAEIVVHKTEEVSQKVLTFRRKFNYFGIELPNEEGSDSETLPAYKPSFIPKFDKGDIVVFKELACPTKRTLKDTLAVVTGVPLTYAERKSRKMRTEDLDYTDQMYMLEHITEFGKLEHSHVLEEDLILYENLVPEELKALEYLSLHFKAIKPIDEEVLLSMMKGEIYMLTRKSWREVI